MRKFHEILAPILLAFVVCTRVEGQVNPNYVYYNPNLDVYRKPDVHILAKAITAQSELAMAKLAHLGMLQAPSLTRIPTRDSANVALSKLIGKDNGNDQLKTEAINTQTGSGNTKISGDKTSVWLADFQKAMASGDPKKKSKFLQEAPGTSKIQETPSVSQKSSIKTIESKPMMTMSQRQILNKTGFDLDNSVAEFTILDSKRKPAPTLTKRAASKTAPLDIKPDSKKLKYLRSKPTVKVSEDLYKKKVVSSSRSIPKLDPKLKATKDDATIIDRKLKLPNTVAEPELEIPHDVIKKKLFGKNPLVATSNLKKMKAQTSTGDVIKRSSDLEKTIKKKVGDLEKKSKKLEKTKVNSNDVITKHKVTENTNAKYREKTRTQKAIESELLMIPLKTSDSRNQKDPSKTEFIPTQKVEKNETNKIGLRVTDSHPNKMSSHIKNYKNLDTVVATNGSLTVDDETLKAKLGPVVKDQTDSVTIVKTLDDQNSWRNARPLFKFASKIGQAKPALNSNMTSKSTLTLASSNQVTPSETIKSKSKSKKLRKRMRRERKRQLVLEKTRKRQMKLVSNSSAASSRTPTTTSSPGYCPRQWLDESGFCLRKSKQGEKFRDAVTTCLKSDSVAYGPGARLITVGKLRKLRKVGNFVKKFKNRAFRINAFKDYDGLWKEYPSGKLVEFWKYFPDFMPAWGHHGDTLIWLSRWNSLRVVRDTEDDHRALCYREKLGVVPSAACGQPSDVECSDHGDCVAGVCVCDRGFGGSGCATNTTRRSGRDAVVHHDDVINCLSDCGPGGGCDVTTGNCVCVQGTTFNDKTGLCECDLQLSKDDCYTFGPSGVNYVNASTYCLSKGLRMAEILQGKDQSNIEALLMGTKNVWLGADNMGLPEEGFRWHSGREVLSGDLGGWAAEQHPRAEQGCLTMAGVIGHTWVTMDCNVNKCCGDMTIDTLCRVY